MKLFNFGPKEGTDRKQNDSRVPHETTVLSTEEIIQESKRRQQAALNANENEYIKVGENIANYLTEIKGKINEIQIIFENIESTSIEDITIIQNSKSLLTEEEELEAVRIRKKNLLVVGGTRITILLEDISSLFQKIDTAKEKYTKNHQENNQFDGLEIGIQDLKSETENIKSIYTSLKSTYNNN